MTSLMDRLKNWRGQKGEGATDGPADGALDLGQNEERMKRQRMALMAAGSIIVLAAGWWIMDTEDDPNDISGVNEADEITVATDELGARNMSEQEWIAMSENRLNQQDSRLLRMQGQGDQLTQMQQELQQLRQENGAMAADGSRVVSAYEQENQSLRQQLAAAQSSPPVAAGPRAMYGANGPAAYQGTGVAPGRTGELKVISFSGDAASTGRGGTPAPARSGGSAGSAVMNASKDYLPANSFAKARVIVGVDAASNVSSQSDPLPVVLRITGPARSVSENGKVLTTNIQGCLVNGAARGDLSSEKVYVRLAKMTCPVGGGRFAETEVKGFIAFGGKTGVRGRVVSREGSLAGQAFFAGLVGGIGRGFSANSQSVLSGTNVSVGGERQKLSAGEIAQAGIGEGVSSAGDMVSEYLIEKAEQYQPVIEMPTGIEVEIVFLEGVQVRN